MFHTYSEPFTVCPIPKWKICKTTDLEYVVYCFTHIMNLLQSAQYLSGVVNGILLTGMKIDYAGGESAIYRLQGVSKNAL